jgi:hypothetical protein
MRIRQVTDRNIGDDPKGAGHTMSLESINQAQFELCWTATGVVIISKDYCDFLMLCTTFSSASEQKGQN